MAPPDRPRVLLTDPIDPAGETLLAARCEVVRAPDATPATLARLATNVDGILLRSPLPPELFERAARLRGICVHGTGTDLVPIELATRRGIPVASVPGGNAVSVAEYCALAMLLFARDFMAIHEAVRSRPWDAARALGGEARELDGATLGIVGVGHIGTRLARIAGAGFGMRVLGHRRRLDRLPAGAEPADLDRVTRESDYLVIALPLAAGTRHLFGAARLAMMRPQAVLVNVGRGAVVDEAALVAALREGRIRGAMLDVYEHYRLEPGHALFTLPNALLTPHLAGATREARARVSRIAVGELFDILEGRRPRHLVNPEAWRDGGSR